MNALNDLINVADLYLQKAIPIILLHGTNESGECSCNKKDCLDIGKHPVHKNPDATQILDVSELRDQLEPNINRNIAGRILPAANIIVIDVDLKNGGIESFSKMESDHGALPATTKVLSGGGGCHLYFKLPEGTAPISFPANLDKIGYKGIDLIRNKNIVLPGSRHKSGQRYRFSDNQESLDFYFADLPQKYIDLFLSKTSSKKNSNSDNKSVSEGGRNNFLYAESAKMFSKGLDENSVLNRLRELNQNSCNPPVDEAELEQIITSAATKKSGPFDRYRFEDSGILYFDPDKGLTLLSNFHAKIAEQIEINDGTSGVKDRYFKIVITHPKLPVSERIISPDELENGSWVPKLDASLIVNGLRSYQQHLRVVLRAFGDTDNRKSVFINLGWISAEGKSYYIANNGAIGANGFDERFNTSTEFGGPLGYEVLSPSSDKELQDLFANVLQLLDVTSKQLTIPLLAAVFRAPLIKFLPTDFCLGLFGPTGTMKSVMAGLFATFYGPEFSYNNLPESFGSTANSIERRAFLTYSSFLIIDDWVPGESSKVKADYILRSHGNRQGRGRMNADTSLKKTYFPRSFTILTGEDIQVEQSLRARLVILETSKGSVDKKQLTNLQKIAAQGVFCKFMGAYLQWIIQQEERIQQEIKDRFSILRDNFDQNTEHGRIAPNLSHLMLGIEHFADFCESKALMNSESASEFCKSAEVVLLSLIETQNRHQEDTDPVERFFESLRAILENKEACIKHNPGKDFGSLSAALGYVHGGHFGFNPSGDIIGEIINGELCLKKSLAFTKIRDFCRKKGEPISLSERGMGDRFKAKGLLLSEDNRTTVKRSIGNNRERCWVFPNWRQFFEEIEVQAPFAPEAPFPKTSSSLDEQLSLANNSPPLKLDDLKAQRELMHKKAEQDGTSGNENLH